MKPLLLSFILLLFSLCCFAQTSPDLDISIKLTPYKNALVYLGSYYGKNKTTVDTAILDAKSEGHFKHKHKLPEGVYFVSSPDNKMLFELLLGKNQRFSIVADTAHIPQIVFKGSPDNDQFKEYASLVDANAKQFNLLNEQVRTAKDMTEVQRIRDGERTLMGQLQVSGDSLIHKYPGSLTAIYIALKSPPHTPAGFIPKNKADSVAGGFYMKQHYWDNVAFNDDRLLYVPFFDHKLDMYFRAFVPPNPDSVIKDMDYMLLYARTGKAVYPYLLSKFTNRYLVPAPGLNKVFIDLFQNFYLKGDTTLVTDSFKKVIYERAYQYMANQVGDPAPALDLLDINDKQVSLYDVHAPYTFIVFWDPTCSHCKEQVPRVDSIYKAKWKAIGMQLYSVNVNGTLMPELRKFVQSNNLSPDWIHTYEPDAKTRELVKNGLPTFRQLYEVYETPTMYLLDKDKHIVGRHLTVAQFDALMEAKQNGKK
ncbi:MAG: redoxin domain-containing protein [Flavipsychrobacter sp.]|nr:redoxin domain-containing protein [Flavipsychrobacter sp.]